LLRAVDHLAVCLAAGDLPGTVDHYQKVFGLAPVFQERVTVGRQAMNSTVVQSPDGAITVTLLEPDARLDPGQIDGFLARHGGAGVQHVAFLTDDIVGAVQALGAGGTRFLATPSSYYDAVADRLGPTTADLEQLRRHDVLIDRDPWGEILQVFTDSMHVRRTYFTEIIERRGAKSFGSGNVKALYEAVRRHHAPAAPTARS
jgi:4-hydroxymandelate synthase